MQTQEVEIKTTPTPPHPSSGFVLVVDDEEHNRILLRDPLEARGYEVCEAENGERALELMSQRIPDVVLLDVMMPRIDGFEVCRRIRSAPETAPVPVLMLTALSERHERLMGIKAGANDFLTKPLDIQDVLLRVANAVRLRQLYDQLQAEQKRSESLLLNVLPGPIAARMKQGELNIVDNFAEATVLLADLVGFTTLCAHIQAEEVVWLLNELFSKFDQLAEGHGLEKIKTMGDAYMVVGGVPVARADHAEAVADLAIAMRIAVDEFNRYYNTAFQFRFSLATGPMIAGVIGRKKFSYDVWGDTVNLANRFIEFADPGDIQVSEATFEKLEQKYAFGRRQQIEMKSGNVVVMHTLCGKA
ncbi:MAG TPA: adenylate/guanylate cyclase domain-containing protein [Verrucomicrobiota bacterium]|nr:adenylate/guanylate cyclase domain-containing protein [Verrucomicrobiota bacterium]